MGTVRKRKPIEQQGDGGEHRHRHQVLLLRQLAVQHGTEMAFTFAAFSYIVALIVDAFLIFFAIFHIIAFDELKTDYKNPIDQCNSLNPLVLPEYVLHIFFNALFLIAGEFFSLFLNVPLIGYHVHRYMNRPVMSGPGLYDPTSIMNADTLNKCQREGWIKLAFYLLSFFYYLYGMIYSLVSS